MPITNLIKGEENMKIGVAILAIGTWVWISTIAFANIIQNEQIKDLYSQIENLKK